MLKSKVHRATVTHAELHYEGSVTLPPELMELAGLLEYEEVHVWNVTRGTRLSTYTLLGEPGSRDICINGAAAHLCGPGDRVILSSFVTLPEAEARSWRPTVVLMGEGNEVLDPAATEVPGPRLRGVEAT